MNTAISKFPGWFKDQSVENQLAVIASAPIVLLFGYFLVWQPVTGLLHSAFLSVKRSVGGDAYIIYQCSKAKAGGRAEFEAAKALGVSTYGLDRFCDFYATNIEATKGK